MTVATEESVDVQIEQLKTQGYVVIPDAISPERLEPIRRRYDELMEARAADVQQARKGSGHVEIKRLLALDPVFEPLMDWPTTFPVARAVIGRDITLATGGEGDYRPAHTPAYISWHNDFSWMPDTPYPRQNFWVRCTYYLEDVTDDMGPFTVLPGSHLAEHACPPTHTDANGQPREIPGQVRVTGKAGTCLINNTEIWHTNTSNTSDRARKLIMIVYKHAWMRPWGDGYEVTPEFAERQTSPLRRQLCGLGDWQMATWYA